MAGAVDLGSVYAKLVLDTKDFESGTQRATGALSAFGSLASGTAGLLKSAVATGAVAATSALVGLGVKGVVSANQLQTLQLQMNGLTKSMELGAQAMAGAYEYAQKSPFQLTEVAGATKTMLAFGMNVDGAVKSLELLGNVSITSGVPIEAIASIFGRVSAQGRLMGGDIQQLTDNGIAVLPALQKQLGKTADEVREMASQGKIGFEQFSEAMESIVDPSILEQLNNTLPRQIDRLKGSVRQLSNAFVGVSVDAVNGYKQASEGITQAVTNLTKNLADQLRSTEMKSAFAEIGNNLVPLIRQISELIEPVMKIIISIAKPLSTALIGLAQGVINMFKAALPSITAFFTALDKSFQQLQPVVAILGTTIGTGLGLLLTALVPVIELITAVIVEVVRLATAFSDQGRAATSLVGIFTQLVSFIQYYVLPVFSAVVSAVLTLASNAFPLLAAALAVVITRMVILKGIAIASAFMSAIGPIMSTIALLGTFVQIVLHVAKAQGIWAAAQWALNTAMAANPIIFIATVIVGLIGIVALVVQKFELWKEQFAGLRIILMILLPPLGLLIEGISQLGKFLGFFSEETEEASSSMGDLADNLKNAEESAGGFSGALEDVDVTGIGLTKGEDFTTSFASGTATIGADLQSSLSGVNTNEVATNLAVSMSKAMREANIAQPIIDALDVQDLASKATAGVREYAQSWSTAFANVKLEKPIVEQLITMGQTLKPAAGLSGQEAADEMADRYKQALISAGIPAVTAAEIARGAPAVKLAAGTLGADSAQNFQNELQKFLEANGVDPIFAASFAQNPELLKSASASLANEGVIAFNEGMAQSLATNNPNNLILNAMNDSPIDYMANGIAIGTQWAGGVNQGIQGSTPNLGGAMGLTLQNASSAQSANATIQGGLLGDVLGKGIITGVSNNKSNVSLTVGETITNAQTLHMGTADSSGLTLGSGLTSGLSMGVNNGRGSINNQVSSVLQSAQNTNIQNANSKGTSLGQGLGGGIQTGVSNKASDIQGSTQGAIDNSMSRVNTSGSDKIGAGIVSGAASGVDNNQKGLWGAVQRMASNAIGWAKGLLGIQSPSKVFADIGKNVALGFGNGVDKYSGQVIDKVSALANEAMSIGSTMTDIFPSTITTPRNFVYSGGSPQPAPVSIYGDITISNQQDADYLLQRLSRRQDLTIEGMVGQ